MNCLHCQSNNIRLCKQKTTLGYLQFRCRDYCKQFNERSGTTFNYTTHREFYDQANALNISRLS